MSTYKTPITSNIDTGTQTTVGRSYKTPTVAQVLIERITTTYSHTEAEQDGIYYWPEPLPTPGTTMFDPLILFRPQTEQGSYQPHIAAVTLIGQDEKQERISVLPTTLRDMASLRDRDNALTLTLSLGTNKTPDGLMRIPLGLIDIPDEQKRDIFCVDLHGSSATLTGGPLLIAGAQNSGKATALQSILLWLTARHTPRQLRCAIIDPNRDLDIMQDTPYIHAADGSSLYTDGSSDEQLTQFAERFTHFITQRRETYPGERWDDQSIQRLRARGAEIPLLLLIINHYHSFEERFKTKDVLKKLFLSVAEARALGIYVIITSAEVSSKYISPDVMAKMGTKIGLFLNDTQRYDLFGRTPGAAETIPGRGLVLTRDRSMHQIQLALPVIGDSEGSRFETFKQELQWLVKQL